MSERVSEDEPFDLGLIIVATLLVFVHLAIAYVMAVVRHVGNPFAAIIYAMISFGWIRLALWPLKWISRRFRWGVFLALGGVISFGMLWFAEWLLMTFARVS